MALSGDVGRTSFKNVIPLNSTKLLRVGKLDLKHITAAAVMTYSLTFRATALPVMVAAHFTRPGRTTYCRPNVN